MPHVELLVPGDPSTRTGGYVYDRTILEGLRALGWTTRVHALDPSFPLPSADALAAARRTLAAIPDGRAVVVDGLALAGLADALAEEAARLRLVALVHHPCGDETGLSPERRERLWRGERAACASVERIVVTSAWTARRLAAEGVPAERIAVVEPGTERVECRDRDASAGVDRGESSGAGPGESAGTGRAGSSAADRVATRADRIDPTPTRAVPPRRAGEPLRLLCVATLTERKGHALLVDALDALRDLPWRLDCVGSLTREPATAAAVREQIARLDLGGRIVLHGELPPRALAERYAAADAFVLPSYLEGYGMALTDAVAHGLPIVSTSAGAIPETVPPEASLLVPPGDRAALTRALRALLDDPALRSRLAAGARAARLGLPTWADAAARFAAAIGDLAGAAERAP